MQKTIITLIITIISCYTYAQSLTGNYELNVSGAELKLILNEESVNVLTGSLVDMNGDSFSLKGEYEETDGFGTISNGQHNLEFELYREDDKLYLTIFPMNNQNQPDYNNGKEFILFYKGNAQDTKNTQVQGRAIQGPLGSKNMENWGGTYSGNINGTNAILQLTQNSNTISGTIDASGYIYNIEGKINGNNMSGKVVDAQSSGTLNTTGTKSGNTINLSLSGGGASINLSFTQNNSGSISQNAQPTSPPGQIDPNLVGHWLYSDSYTSGSYSFASQTRLIINADGTYLYGDTEVAGGGGGVSGTSGGSGMEKGQWKVEGKIIYVNDGTGWYPYARYYVEGNDLMFTFENNKRQIWKRVR